jgi:hypothetical protein
MLSSRSRFATARAPVSSPTSPTAGRCVACGRQRPDRARLDVVGIGAPVAFSRSTRNLRLRIFFFANKKRRVEGARGNVRRETKLICVQAKTKSRYVSTVSTAACVSRASVGERSEY